jgi:Raf kinase inhibitor-like YbhB/YbcL family protein
LNDYEDISGFLRSGNLLDQDMVPLKIQRFQLVHAATEDTDLLLETLDRECRRFCTRIIRKPNGRIPESDGEDVPPPLIWSGAPAGTKSFALIVDDPDAPGGTFCHWAIFDISPAATSVGEEMPIGVHEAVNDFGRMGYGGPCPPRGQLHHYRFRLMALDVARLNIPPDARYHGVQRAAEPHKLAEATLVGT